MFLSKLSIKRPAMMTMFILVFVVFGILAFIDLPINLMPEFDIPVVTIMTTYPGAGPNEIETQINRRIEDAVSSISRINFIQSYAMDNVSFVAIMFELGKDNDIALREVKDNIDMILASLPEASDRPVVLSMDIDEMPVMDLVFGGDFPLTELYDYTDMYLLDRFSQIDGVARINVTGGQDREIQVVLNPQSVTQNSISLLSLSQIIAANNIDIPGGQFQERGQETALRFLGQIENLERLGDIEIPTAGGMKRLKDIADILDAGEEIRERSIFFDNRTGTRQDNVISLSIIPTPEGNLVEIAQSVREELPAIRTELPAGMNIEIVSDRSEFIQDSVNDTLMNILLGILLTGLILFLFLNDLRSTFIVALAMPTSIISTFLMMQLFGFTINIMTLMGLSTAVGILVTNSVIVLENIFRHKNMGHDRVTAADAGTAETTVAVVASTMTNIMVFLPIATMSSMAGQVFKEFGLVVAFATVFSLLISFTLTPMLASLILPEKQKERRITKKFDETFKKLERFYRRTLASLIKKRIRVIALLAASIIAFLITAFFGLGAGVEFVPAMDQGYLDLEVELPVGYDLSETAEVVERIESILLVRPEVESILTTLGSMGYLDSGPNMAAMDIKLVDIRERELSSHQVAELYMEELATIPNATITLTVQSGMGGAGGGGSDLEFSVLGPEHDRIVEISEEIMNKISDIPGLTNIVSSHRPGRPELTFRPRYDKMAEAGVSVQELATTLRASVEGIVSTQYRDRNREYDLKVMLDRSTTDSEAKLASIPVVTQRGTYTFSQLTDIEFAAGPTMLLQKDKLSAVNISGSVTTGVTTGQAVSRIRQVLQNDVELPEGYRIDWGTQVEILDDTVSDMLGTFFLALLLTYMLLVAILESFVQPLYILATLPLGLIGVFLAILITGQTLSLVAMMAIIMLVGIVVNNAILLLDQTNRYVRDGKGVRESLLEACPIKLKPIVMATMAIIFGMLPMAVGLGASGKEMRQPMGIVSIGGLIVSAFLTLYVIPAVYYLFHRDDKKS